MKIKVTEKAHGTAGTITMNMQHQFATEAVRDQYQENMETYKKVSATYLNISANIDRTESIQGKDRAAFTPDFRRGAITVGNLSSHHDTMRKRDRKTTNIDAYISPIDRDERPLQKYTVYKTRLDNKPRERRTWLEGEIEVLRKDWNENIAAVNEGKITLGKLIDMIIADIHEWSTKQVGPVSPYFRKEGSIRYKVVYLTDAVKGIPGKDRLKRMGNDAYLKTLTLPL